MDEPHDDLDVLASVRGAAYFKIDACYDQRRSQMRVPIEVRSEAINDLVRNWCRMYSYPMSNSLSISQFGREAATKLAAYVCRRSSFLFQVWVASGFDAS